VIREDRELLAALARLNTAMTPLAMRIMDDTANAAELRDYARHLITAGEWLHRRADRVGGVIVDGEVLIDTRPAIPTHTVEPYRES
jgi:hypothetical protein